MNGWKLNYLLYFNLINSAYFQKKIFLIIVFINLLLAVFVINLQNYYFILSIFLKVKFFIFNVMILKNLLKIFAVSFFDIYFYIQEIASLIGFPKSVPP